MANKKSILHQEVHPVFQLFVFLIVLLGLVLVIVTARDNQDLNVGHPVPQASAGY